ncbi:MAG: endonuclease/exonuclease/phosphatase family protein, partial [Actinomycetota bacterium]|nr:endonuclease/exonuclease/phosphatase family protein [Actinomycetota bacterium]
MTTRQGIVRTAGLVAAAGIVLTSLTPAQAADPGSARFASFNASLNRSAEGQLITDLSTPNNAQAANVAEIIQRIAPDVLLINEFDFDPAGTALQLFQDNYLSVPHNGAPAIDYPYSFTAPSNTGVPSGFDLDNSGSVGGPGDAFGFGFFPGQFGMAVYSKFPINVDAIRTFQTFLWKDMPGALLPDDPATPAPADWYSAAELEVFRLSSKSHWDLPIQIGPHTVHFLVSHPTPPVFDGAEDRNGTRNFDEIRLWGDYITPTASGYIYDDEGLYGGLPAGAHFVIAGDQNSDPLDGDSIPGDILNVMYYTFFYTNRTPSSIGAVQASRQQGGINETHLSPHRNDTAD